MMQTVYLKVFFTWQQHWISNRASGMQNCINASPTKSILSFRERTPLLLKLATGFCAWLNMDNYNCNYILPKTFFLWSLIIELLLCIVKTKIYSKTTRKKKSFLLNFVLLKVRLCPGALVRKNRYKALNREMNMRRLNKRQHNSHSLNTPEHNRIFAVSLT